MSQLKRAIERQQEFERDMQCRGIQKAAERSASPEALRGSLSRFLLTLEAGITYDCLGALAQPGPVQIGVRKLLPMDTQKVAAITLDCCLSALTRRTSLVKLALHVGRTVETQAKLECHQHQDKKRFSSLYKAAVAKATNAQKLRYHLLKALDKDDSKHIDWTREECLAVGFLCIDCVIQETQLVELERVYQNKRYTTYVVPTDKAGELMNDLIRDKVSTSVQYGPLVCPPKPWAVEDGKYTGGFYTPEIQIPFVKSMNRSFRKRLPQYDHCMVEHVSAVNRLMAVPFVIDKEALYFAQYLTERSLIQGYSLEKRELPAKYEGSDPKELLKYRKEMRETSDWNNKLQAKSFQIRQILQTAHEYAEEPEIYFAINCDFRGRLNYFTGGSILNPQGSDFAKSLIKFKNPSLCEGEAWHWFLIHGANEFGVKGTLEDRMRWANDDTLFIASARAPAEFTWWTHADNPLCFLRWCREYARAQECHAAGKPFYTQIPIHMDGTCNGIQHLAALARDSRAAAAVNMLPSEHPQDMYAIVAELVREKAVKETDPEFVHYARMWIEFDFDRNLTKRQCMTKSYGATKMSCLEYTRQYIRDRIENGAEDVFGENVQRASLWMSDLIWESINEVVDGPQRTMDWLQALARAYNKEGKIMEWTTPSGFVVNHYYPEWKSRQVKTFIAGQLVKPRVREEADNTISKHEVVNGVSANFVHSLDAAHLVKVVNAMDCDMVTIHDSFGVRAEDAPRLARVIRSTFVDMYETHDPLMGLAMRAAEDIQEVPQVPERGDLDLLSVMKADYFFS